MLENDAAVNIDIKSILENCLKNKIDFVGQFYKIIDEAKKNLLKTQYYNFSQTVIRFSSLSLLHQII